MTRRIGGAVALAAVLITAGGAAADEPFGLDAVAARAAMLAREPYREPALVPEWMRKLTYDQWRDIRFRPDQALWRNAGSRFTVELFHLGLFYENPVLINVVEGGAARHLAFTPKLFDYGKNRFAADVPADLGFAGFRLHYPLKTSEYRDEVIVFLGASYFRAVGRDTAYGLSARGIAVDTIRAGQEEFPAFREFWLVRPAPDATAMTIYALLDGPRVTGAYRFVITPGVETRVDVEARLYLRAPVASLGIAPLTSMFLFGENTIRRFDNFRPEVHDSDGLLMESTTGEWLWRPLENPSAVSVNSFTLPDPKGFGLIQRDRVFDHYQDLETHQETRPSVWIEPAGRWGTGSVQLLRIPTLVDSDDNMVAFWSPEALPPPATEMRFAYAMWWYTDDPARPPAGRVVATRRERDAKSGTYRFVVDFAGGPLASAGGGAAPDGVVTVTPVGKASGSVVEQHVVPNPATGGWRLTFQVGHKGTGPLELRAFLARKGDALTETWSYAFEP